MKHLQTFENHTLTNKDIEIEYYDRDNDYHGIGTFRRLGDDETLEKGDKFIVPPAKKGDKKNNGIMGVIEGRHKHPAEGKPLLLTVKSVTDSRINSVGYGSWIKHCCYVENK